MKQERSATILAVVAALVMAACGGTPAVSVSPPTQVPAPSATQRPTLAPPPPVEPTGQAPSEQPTEAPAASLTPGSIQYRVINLIGDDAVVDVYVRTQGLLEAAPAHPGLGFGEMTDSFAPPEPGNVIVTTAGAGDPTCVATCPHIVSSSSTNFGEGSPRTMILYDEGTQELWHNPEPTTVGTTGNALRPADPSTALLMTTAVGLQNADFGLRLAFDGDAGCQVNRVSEGVLVGGNQIGEFAFDGGSVSVTLHDNADLECSDAPVGGPFEVNAETGERVLLVLFGEPGSMEALTLPV